MLAPEAQQLLLVVGAVDSLTNAPTPFIFLFQGLCEKRAEAFIDDRTVHKVLRRAAEGGFPYLKRRCLEFCLIHLGEVSSNGDR